jgi:hypothetical protein
VPKFASNILPKKCPEVSCEHLPRVFVQIFASKF